MTRILVVDDKEDNLYYLQALLAGHDCAVEVARHGAEALVVARQSPPDLVISDLLMPVMDGYTLLRHWKADPRLKHVPFIVYTATYTEAQDERLALDLGADAFILKPAEPDQFIARMRAVLDKTIGSEPSVPAHEVDEQHGLLKTYSETLIRKLEEKTLQLEETNNTLQRDIEERKRVEIALRASESEFRLLIESIPHIVWITAPDGNHLGFNQRWFDDTGFTLEESLGDGWNQAFHPDDRERAANRWREATESGEPYEIEYRLRRPDGTYHWMLGRALPLRDEAGSVVKWFGTCTDIHELKQAQAQITEQAQLLDQTQDAVLLHDLDHRILYWNKGAERIHGWTADEAIGRTIDELHCPDTSQLSPIMDVLLRRGEWSGELRLVDRSGADLIAEGRWTLLPETDTAARSILAVNTDVTERKKIEAQFFRSQRLESIGTLAGGIAHDLNNLLAPIVMGIDLLREEEHDTDIVDVIDTMDTSAQRGTDLLRQILSFARGIDGARVVVWPSKIVAEVIAMAATTFPKDIEVSSNVESDLWPVIGDPTQLNQVLLNLCLNARDAMPDGGHLTVAAHNTELDEHLTVMDKHLDAGRYVVLQVRDDGCGMSPELVERIFEPFWTTKNHGAGTGLGLSTVMGIVNSHRGFVHVDSRLDHGSVFEVYLPAQATPTTATSEPST